MEKLSNVLNQLREEKIQERLAKEVEPLNLLPIIKNFEEFIDRKEDKIKYQY